MARAYKSLNSCEMSEAPARQIIEAFDAFHNAFEPGWPASGPSERPGDPTAVATGHAHFTLIGITPVALAAVNSPTIKMKTAKIRRRMSQFERRPRNVI